MNRKRDEPHALYFVRTLHRNGVVRLLQRVMAARAEARGSLRVMLAFLSLVVAFVAAGVTISFAAEGVATNDAHIGLSGNEDQPVASQASREPVQASRPTVVALITAMDGNEPDGAKRAYHTLFRRVQQPWNVQERQTLSRVLAAELGAEHSVDTRRKLCRLLSYVGGDECVDALYKMFMDADIREMVRWSLIRIPFRRATQALVAALQITSGEFRIALLNAIGEKGDKRAVPLLRSGARSPDEAIRRAAVDALAHMPDPSALATILAAVTTEKPGAVRSLLAVGATLADAGMLKGARVAFRAAGDSTLLTAAECCRAMHGLGRVGEAQDVTTILKAIGNRAKWKTDWARVNAAGLQALVRIPGKKATDVIAETLASSSGPIQVDLLDVLGNRVSEMTEEAAAKIREAASDRDEQVRRAATEALKAIDQ